MEQYALFADFSSQPSFYPPKNKSSNFQCPLMKRYDESGTNSYLDQEQWSCMSPTASENYLPKRNNSFVYPNNSLKSARFSPKELNILDALLQECCNNLDFVDGCNAQNVQNCSKRPNLGNGFVNISDPYLTTPRFENINHATNPDKGVSREHCNFLSEDYRNVRGKNVNRSSLKSVSSASQEQLQNKDMKRLLPTTSLDENCVVGGLQDTLENDTSYHCIPSCVKNEQQTGKQARSKRTRDVKDARYWKRRLSNNAAAKKSRDAKKDRYALMEKRIKQLEVENAAQREHLNALRQKELELCTISNKNFMD